MSAAAPSFRKILTHLPPNALLRLQQVSWDAYEKTLAVLEQYPGFRASYFQGELNIMSPRPDHERPKDFIHDLARLLAFELNLPMETMGSATFRRRRKDVGVEPDTCFYVQNAHRVIGRQNINLDRDPPPDVAVEIDITSGSGGKFPIYAALEVPEVWRYDGTTVTFYALQGGQYQVVTHSLAFPVLPSAVVAQFLAQSLTDGQSAALQDFRRWLQAQLAV